MAQRKKEYGIMLDVSQFSNAHNPQGLTYENPRNAEPARLLVETLRYAGVIVNREGHSRFIIPQPPELTGSAWQSQNLGRLLSFGIKGTSVVRDKGSYVWYRDSVQGKRVDLSLI